MCAIPCCGPPSPAIARRAENIAARRALRAHPAIVYSIQLFWNCLDLRKNIEGDVLLDEYTTMSIKLQRALVPGARFDRKGCVDMAHADWQRDVVTEVQARREEAGMSDMEVSMVRRHCCCSRRRRCMDDAACRCPEISVCVVFCAFLFCCWGAGRGGCRVVSRTVWSGEFGLFDGALALLAHPF